jgi:hypothetical protein
MKNKKYIKQGIYKILNLINGKFYIGSTNYLPSRKSQHFSLLKKNKHTNTHLQRSFNKHGIENFKFEIIEQCDICNIIEKEQYWIDLLKPTYNIRKIAQSNLGFNHSEKTKNKIGKTVLKNWKNEEYRVKTIKGHCKPILCYNLKGELLFEFNSAKEAGEKLNIFPNHITKICKNKGFSTHSYIFRYREDNYPLNLNVENILKERQEKNPTYVQSDKNRLKSELFYNNISLGIFKSLKEISDYLKLPYSVIFQIKENHIFKHIDSIKYNNYKITILN